MQAGFTVEGPAGLQAWGVTSGGEIRGTISRLAQLVQVGSTVQKTSGPVGGSTGWTEQSLAGSASGGIEMT